MTNVPIECPNCHATFGVTSGVEQATCPECGYSLELDWGTQTETKEKESSTTLTIIVLLILCVVIPSIIATYRNSIAEFFGL